MSKKGKAGNSRDAPQKRGATVGIVSTESAWLSVCGDGYKPLTSCPEVQMCAGVYADLISTMTLHLMQNTGRGDVRIRNELSKKLDIAPNNDMTRQTFMSLIVWVMLTQGNQVTVPQYRRGLLENLLPVPPSAVSFVQDGNSYRVRISGEEFKPDEVLHFIMRPNPETPYEGMGYRVSLRDVVQSLRQTNATKRAVMESPSPSIIVRVDGLTEEFASKEGREKLRQQYIDSSERGKPWLLPSEAFQVEQVKPLTLNDLAIKQNLELDKRAVAAIFGVPPFLVGIGEFNLGEFRFFVRTRVMAVAKAIEQELTKKLLISPDLYLRFNQRSLMNYDTPELVQAGVQLVDRMALRRNELRDWIGLPPDEEMDELLALENYVPADRLGDQKKLEGGGTSEE